MRTPLKAVVLLAIAILAIVAFSYGFHIHREFQSKAEWSVLQAADFNNRQSSNSSNLLLMADGAYHLAGIITRGQKPILSPLPRADRAWILLDPKYPPAVKILATEGRDFGISRTEFDEITAYTRVNPEVASVLSSHLEVHVVLVHAVTTPHCLLL